MTRVTAPSAGSGPVDEVWSAAVARSIATFQLGETGDGTHLFAALERAGRHDLAPAFTRFIADENRHARLLAAVLDRIGTQPIDRHWTDHVFAGLRRVSGTRTELTVLLIAEVVGLAYYRIMAAGAPCPDLAELFAAIAEDEERHLIFITGVLVDLMTGWSPVAAAAARSAFVVGAAGAATVAAVDHRRALAAAGAGPADLLRGAARSIADVLARGGRSTQTVAPSPVGATVER